MNIRDLIETKVNALWQEFKAEDYCKFSPNSIAEVPDNGIIFIGINPSMIKKVRLKLIEKDDINCEFYKLTYDESKEYRYFKKFFDVARKTGLNWGHLDILYNRETNQKKVKGLLKTERGKDFIYKQCMITKTVLDYLIDNDNPRIFVVTNSFARDLLGRYRKKDEPKKPKHWIGYDFIWNERPGTYFYKNNPFFFSSMLTGQRALDNGSYERLVWHVNLIKESLSADSKI
ncbi:hypothetical protein N7U66_16780 [Lacinutrix neustonica]|uniref:Uncharacterized protein n=1 Tax=Lacinutrix neustonica TaxID=2980107 RepID=A0A9E8MUF9_9FLAO|nr:hypothetical protein [Lacinutrix neustonica]WAC01586.1 hypothetical protein N7U66_16780 [Lacinutrix neustonica]